MLKTSTVLAALTLFIALAGVALAQMPAGHPPVAGGGGTPGGQPGLPAGHPALPGGHPPIKPAATQPVTVKLSIETTQGTKDGPKIADEDVTVETMAINGQAQKTTVKLDAEGEAKVRNLVVVDGSFPVVTLLHGGVTYQVRGEAFTAAKPSQVVSVMVYESTDKEPAWTITMRHLMVQPMPGGLAVQDFFEVNNPTDRAWAGAPVAQGGSATQPALRSTTLSLSLPAGASNVDYGLGFGDGTTQVKDGKITSSAALIPGKAQYAMQYILPIKDGKATLDFSAPVMQDAVKVLAAQDDTKITAAGFEAKTTNMGEGTVRVYQIQKVAADKQLTVQFEGIKEMKAPTDPNKHGEAPSVESGSNIKLAAGIGAGVLVLASAAILVFKPARKAEKSEPKA